MLGEIFLVDRCSWHCCYTSSVSLTFITSRRLHRNYMAGSLCAYWNPQQSSFNLQDRSGLTMSQRVLMKFYDVRTPGAGLWWTGWYQVHCRIYLRKDILSIICFFLHVHHYRGDRFIYLLDLFFSHQSVFAIWEPRFKLLWGFSGEVHTRSVCCFNLQGGTDVILPTTTCRPYPLDWHWLSLLWLVQFLDCDLQASHWIYQITTNVLRWTSEQNDYHSFYIGDLVYLQRIRTWYYCHIDEGCKMGFLHHTGNWR